MAGPAGAEAGSPEPPLPGAGRPAVQRESLSRAPRAEAARPWAPGEGRSVRGQSPARAAGRPERVRPRSGAARGSPRSVAAPAPWGRASPPEKGTLAWLTPPGVGTHGRHERPAPRPTWPAGSPRRRRCSSRSGRRRSCPGKDAARAGEGDTPAARPAGTAVLPWGFAPHGAARGDPPAERKGPRGADPPRRPAARHGDGQRRGPMGGGGRGAGLGRAAT